MSAPSPSQSPEAMADKKAGQEAQGRKSDIITGVFGFEILVSKENF
jgi:hypothetical protein